MRKPDIAGRPSANIFRSLRHRNYRLFITGQGVSLIGTWIQRIATPWLVYHLTGSAFMLGLTGFATQIPTFLIAPFAGVLSDRWNRYHIMIATQVAAMIQALVLAILVLTGAAQFWHIIVLGILLGCINAFDVPARQSFVPEMVGNREDLGNAIAINSSMVNAARLIGPSVAGMLIAFAGEGVCFLLNAASYVFVIVSLLMIRVVPKKAEPDGSGLLRSLKEGFIYAAGYRPIRYSILLLGLLSLMGMPYTILMPVISREVLHGGSQTFGFLMASSGLGALSGALYLASRKNVSGVIRLIPLAAGLFGIGLIAFSFSSSFMLSLFLMAVTGCGMMVGLASCNTLLQTVSDDDKRGRVMSFYTMAFMGTAPFGSIMAGSLAGWIGAPATIMAGGLVCVAGALVYAKQLPSLKALVAPVYSRQGLS